MLSKVLSGLDSARAQAAIFPFVSLNPAMESGFEVQAPSISEAPVVTADTSALEQTIQHLESQLDRVRAEAFEAGRQQGDHQAKSALQPVLERLNASIAGIMAMRSEVRLGAERDMVQLALLIAKRVLHREIAIDQNALSAIARVAFERLTRSETYTVTVHPRFAAAITAALPGSQAARVRIEPDPDCAPGTLVIHSSEGVIDASVDAQLEEITRGLADRL
jgi:flagellar assembly protein FliH